MCAVSGWLWALVAVAGSLVLVAAYDLTQRRHTILRIFPVVGHLRFWLEAVGPELRQYIVTSNDAEKPFSRDQRRWIYSSASGNDTLFGFGTDNDVENMPGYLIAKPVVFPIPQAPAGAPGGAPDFTLPCAKVLGASRGRARAFRMASAVNISSMSYGSLSGVAIEALNKGAGLAGCLQGTGEGGLTLHHRHGGDLIWQIGTGYFCCRDARGNFDHQRFLDVVGATPSVRAIEIKLSQGAKPGVGALLPAAKVTADIAALRGVPVGVDCVSPARHSAFSDVDSMLDFVETLATSTGLPVGIKTAVGDVDFFRELARAMATDDRGVDFITIDGGEGGTGAASLVFGDHVALPFKWAFSRVYRVLAEEGVASRLVLLGAGKLGLPENALLAFALGCDGVNVGREAMLSIGCIQSQRCHTDRCPTGITTHSRWRTRGLDPTLKSVRAARFVTQLRKELLDLSHACGEPHPALVTTEQLELLDEGFQSRSARDVFAYEPGWGRPSPADQAELRRLMAVA